MFTAAEFRLIKSNCLPEMDRLLGQLSIPAANWQSNDEYRLYDELDNKITDKICALMKSSSILDGYCNLLKMGNIQYDFSETDTELLNKIIANKDKIIRGAEQSTNTPRAESSPIPPQVPLQSSRTPQPTTKTIIKEEVETLMGPIILGAILIVIAIACFTALDSSIIGVILAVLGIISAALGLKGRKTRVSVTVPNPAANNQPVAQPLAPPLRQQSKNTQKFTAKEISEIMSVLSQVNKISSSI